MNELENKIFIEKYRPQSFEELIFNNKSLILKYLKDSKSIPSFIFYSHSPGTGKTTVARLIAKYLDCDISLLNSSDERGIDTVREKVKLFSQSLSSQKDIKRLVFMDEADGLTRQAQDSLRNLMEEYSENVFFIFTANDISKIIEPIRSRCVTISFENPDKKEIIKKLEYICKKEAIEYDIEDLFNLIENNYPDIRSMIKSLQHAKIDNKSIENDNEQYQKMLQTLLSRNVKELYSRVHMGNLDLLLFNKWLFKHIYDNFEIYGFEKVSQISKYLADTEKAWNLGVALEVVFISNMTAISDILSKK